MQPYPVGLGTSPEDAAVITQSERDNLDLVAEVVEKERLDVEFWRGELLESECRRGRRRAVADGVRKRTTRPSRPNGARRGTRLGSLCARSWA